MTSPLNATTTPDGRSYLWPPTNETFTGVTTTIAGGTPTSPQLLRWIARTNAWYAVEHAAEWLPMAEVDPRGVVEDIAGAAERYRDEAATRGTAIHAWADAIANGTAKGMPPVEIADYVESFQRFTDEWRPRYAFTEATVYSRRYGYAGTFDWMAHLDGRLILGDIKSKLAEKKLYGTAIRLQLAAYRYADFIGLPDGTEAPMPEVEGCVALVLKPNDYDLIPVDAGPEAFEAFLSVQRVRRFCAETEGALSERLVAP